ncbi:acriflavin resistance protein [Thalassobaculum fulvum]|uniref:Acriflavin resistance protein n=1 Tax=Thalassobaculum fulvum TaxID=1633335 RepID=A0A918XSM9_9PROT|nr:efflux RND transporter permease subunit [Thalassobaculum fulvum]GHD52770.1 acriflavin resistance protein [Thalassobaculum fulvum]
MLLSDFFIRRPVFAIVVNALLAVLGLYALLQLSVRELPQFEVPLATVTTSFPGAASELVEAEVTSRVEDAISSIDAVDYFSSISSSGLSTVTVTFKGDVDSAAAVAEVRAQVEAIRGQLPADALAPVVTQLSVDAAPILYLSLSSTGRSAMELTELVDTIIRTPLSTLAGVASVSLLGERKYAMHVKLDPFKLDAFGLTPEQVRTAVVRQSATIPAGSVEEAGLRVDVVADTALSSVESYRRIVLKADDGYLVRVQDVAEVAIQADEVRTGVLINGKPGLAIGVLRQSGANALAVSKAVLDALPAVRASLPGDVTLEPFFDSTVSIRQSVDEVFATLRDAVVLVIAVVVLFLGSWRASAVTVVTIPLSLIGTLAFMLLMGYSLNIFSLLAIVLSVGLVVDDAIVDVENVQRHIARGLDPVTAAFVGSREIGFAVVATTLTLASVYLPIGFLPGLMGALFQEFAFTLAAAVILSGFISRTLSPMMCSRMLVPEKPKPAGRAQRSPMKVLEAGYRRLLEGALAQRWVVFVVFVAVGAIAVAAARTLPSQLAPTEDQGYVMAAFSGAPGSAYSTLEKNGEAIAAVFDTVPEKTGSLILLGSPDSRSGFAILLLSPIAERDRSAAEIGASIEPALLEVPGIRINVVDPGVLSGGGQLPVQMVIKSTGDYPALAGVMDDVLAAARGVSGVASPTSNLRLSSPRLTVDIDRDLAGDLGVDVTALANTVAAALGDYRVSTFTYGTRNYNVIVELDDRIVTQEEGIGLVQVADSGGREIPLRRLVTLEHTVGADQLAHFDGQRSATLSASLADGASLGTVLKDLEPAVAEVLPPGYTVDWTGPSRQLKDADASAGLVFVLSFLFIYGFLAAQFESFRDPFIILLVVPFSVLGSLLGLAEAGGSLNLYSGIGLITLVGLVAKQGILVTEFANQLRDEGRSIHDAVLEASVTRLRPILMTTVSMIVGAMPLIYNVGSGSNGRFQIGVVLIGGLIVGTLLSLFVVPATYSFATRRVRRPLVEPPSDAEARRLLHGALDAPPAVSAKPAAGT